MARKHRTTFGKRLTDLMSERGVSVKEAAQIAGVPSSTLAEWRAGSLTSNMDALQRLAHSLGVSLDFLLTGKDFIRNSETLPTVDQVFKDGGVLFDGFAKILVQRLVPLSEISQTKAKRNRT